MLNVLRIIFIISYVEVAIVYFFYSLTLSTAMDVNFVIILRLSFDMLFRVGRSNMPIMARYLRKDIRLAVHFSVSATVFSQMRRG